MNDDLYCNTCKRLANTLCVEMKHETEMRDEQPEYAAPDWSTLGAIVYQPTKTASGESVDRFEFKVQSGNRLLGPGEAEQIATMIVREHNNHKALVAALREAKQIIKTWHGPEAWEIYDQHSPEMIRLNRALALAEED